MERDVALMRVRFLEAEKVKVEESITCLEGELVEASFNSAAEKDTKEKLQQRVRAVARVNALLTDRMNETCFDLNKKNNNQNYNRRSLLPITSRTSWLLTSLIRRR